MKLVIQFFYVLICTVFFASCEHNDDVKEESTIASKWNVIQTNGGFSQAKNYKKGTFTWYFDMTKQTITIVNIADIFTALDIPSFTNNQGGVYSFEIVEKNGIDFLVVGNRKAPIKFEKNRLVLDYGIALDDIGYIFER